MLLFFHTLLSIIWQTGIIPEDWRKGVIIPSWKRIGCTSNYSNYCGITLLSFPRNFSQWSRWINVGMSFVGFADRSRLLLCRAIQPTNIFLRFVSDNLRNLRSSDVKLVLPSSTSVLFSWILESNGLPEKYCCSSNLYTMVQTAVSNSTASAARSSKSQQECVKDV